MKKINEVDILAISGVFLPFIVFFFDVKCIFKTIFHIPCISCGLTRAFIAIIHLKFLDAIKYNILSIPLFLFIIIFYFLYIFNKEYLIKTYSFLSKKYLIIIVLLLFCWIFKIIFSTFYF